MQNNKRQTVVAVYSDWKSADNAIANLRNSGFTNEEISIISKEHRDNGKTYDDNISDGVVTGGTIGGIGGLLLSAGALAIPGVGPILAAGPIAAAVTGAAAGGVVGGLVDLGIPSEDSKSYEQSVARGEVLAIVHTFENKVNTASEILRKNGAQRVKVHPAK